MPDVSTCSQQHLLNVSGSLRRTLRTQQTPGMQLRYSPAHTGSEDIWRDREFEDAMRSAMTVDGIHDIDAACVGDIGFCRNLNGKLVTRCKTEMHALSRSESREIKAYASICMQWLPDVRL